MSETPTEDTFAEWLYNRIAKRLGPQRPWAALTEEDREYWAHEAEAVRRASERGGFKDYDPEMSNS